MMTEIYRRKRNWYARRIQALGADIAAAAANNAVREKVITEKSETDALATDVSQHLERLRLIQSRAIKENEDFRTRRLSYLSEMITEMLFRVFSAEGYVAEVTCNFNRKDTIQFTLKDGEGYVYSPLICNGKLLQYLSAFGGVYCIAKSLGSANLFIDEAFGVSSEANLSVIGDIIDNVVCEGMQVVLVSQNPALYLDLPRREFHLITDRDEKCAKLESVQDFGRSVDSVRNQNV